MKPSISIFRTILPTCRTTATIMALVRRRPGEPLGTDRSPFSRDKSLVAIRKPDRLRV